MFENENVWRDQSFSVAELVACKTHTRHARSSTVTTKGFIAIWEWGRSGFTVLLFSSIQFLLKYEYQI